jgi:hypothetical protein
LISFYANDEVQGTTTLFDNLQVSLADRAIDIEAGQQNKIVSWWIEMNTSVNNMTRPDGRSLVAYIRNFVVLRNPEAGDMVTILATKPK